MRLLCASLIFIGSLTAQVTYDAVASGTIGTGTTLTFSHTTGAGSNRAMAVICTVASSDTTVMPDISTVTYAGVSLSQLIKVNQNWDTYMWTLPDGTQPTTGANNVVVTLASTLTGLTGNPSMHCASVTVTGVDSVTTWTVSNCSASGSSGTPSCTLGASGANDLVVMGACQGTGWGSPGAGITQRYLYNSSINACEALAIGTAAGNTTSLSWTDAGSDYWQMVGAAFKASSGGGGAATLRRNPITM